MNPTIGQRIRAVRMARRMNLEQLAAAISRRAPVVWSIEHGRTHPDAPRLEALCAALGVTVREIQSPYWRSLCARDGISLAEAK